MKNIRTVANHRLQDDFSTDAAELDALLAQLASATSRESAPSAVRQQLLAEARLQAKLPLRPRPRLATVLAGSLSAVLAVLLVGAMGAGISLVLGRSRLSSTARTALRSLGMEKAPSPSAALPSGKGDAATLPAPGAASGDDDFLLLADSENSAPSAESGSSSDPALSSEIFALPESDTAIANGTEATVRVSVPDSQLLAWGVPSARGLDDEVPADLLLGDDGLPQAIRVLPASTTASSNAEETYP